MLSDYQLTIVDSGEAAIDVADASPDLVILDINLPALGLVSALDIEDEDRLADLIEGFSVLIKGELKTLAENNMQMQELIRDLQTPPPELLSLMEEKTESDDGLLF